MYLMARDGTRWDVVVPDGTRRYPSRRLGDFADVESLLSIRSGRLYPSCERYGLSSSALAVLIRPVEWEIPRVFITLRLSRIF